jgi:hypothetical protein
MSNPEKYVVARKPQPAGECLGMVTAQLPENQRIT